VAAIGGLPWLADDGSSGLERAVHMLSLNRYRRDVPLVSCPLFLGPRTGLDAFGTSVVADAIYHDIVIDHGLVVDAVNVYDIDVGHRSVIEEAIAVPASAHEPKPK
jgi:hypothetical protein